MQHDSDHISGSTFDFKSFFLKVLSHWKLILGCVLLSLVAAYLINERMLPIYRLSNTISIKDDQNPFFTSNTSLTFNWGGTSDKVNTAITILRSRSHNEEVVERLRFYVRYLKDGEYRRVNAYGETPFRLVPDTTSYQALETLFTLEFQDAERFTLSAEFPEEKVPLQDFGSKDTTSMPVPREDFSREFRMNQRIRLPFFNATLYADELQPEAGDVYYIVFQDFNEVVSRFQELSVSPQEEGSSVLQLSLAGDSTRELEDFLNGSVRVLSQNMLERKNLYATKTLKFIDSSLSEKSMELERMEEELDRFRNRNNITDLSVEAEQLSGKLMSLDLRKEEVDRQLAYYESLEEYLQTRDDYSNVPAPSVAGIVEESVVQGVGRILALAEERRKYQYSLQESSPVFQDIDRQINAVKAVLLENIASSQQLLQRDLQDVNRDIAQTESSISELPQEERGLLKIQRKYSLSEQSYTLFLQKRSEAGLIKAANVSDVMVIDTAKDTGDVQIGPNKTLNYVMALMVGGMLPLSFVFFMVFFNTNLHNPQEISRLSGIPVLGSIGRNRTGSSLVVYEHPKSPVAESFRSLRSSLQFMYRRQEVRGSRTVLLTSSVSGEGKTFCAMNLASVFALSEKKTLLLGADLRKPKIFGDFGIKNETGLANYLIRQKDLGEITQQSPLPHLDIITSGTLPPNPSELLMNERMDELMEELRQRYDYIIIDTPPVAIVADAFNLLKYADASLYVLRQDYTKRGMLEFINEKYEKGEVENLSFVLNHFEQSVRYGYGYGYDYSYGRYAEGYHDSPRRSGFRKWWEGVKRNFQ